MRKADPVGSRGVALVVAGCGGDDDETTTGSGTTDTVEAEKQATTLDVSMTEFKFTPANPELARGPIEITATNKGKTPHELVLLKTDADPSKLRKGGQGVSEKDSVGEIPEVAPGESGVADVRPQARQVRDGLQHPGPLRRRDVRVPDRPLAHALDDRLAAAARQQRDAAEARALAPRARRAQPRPPRIAPITTFISSCANAAPRQRRTPPPNGTQV